MLAHNLAFFFIMLEDFAAHEWCVSAVADVKCPRGGNSFSEKWLHSSEIVSYFTLTGK